MADIDALLRALTLEEKASLTAGSDFFATVGVDRLGIPVVNVTDGPCGAKGLSFAGVGGPASTCVPCGSALGATWDPSLAEAVGALVGREALDRACRGLLAPTVNLHRSPLAGRNFECYSEDPLLSGRLAAGYVRGVQSNGVFATVKHFVGNDAEFERNSISSVIDERSLRELYLVPFELAVREGGALAIMTGYNRLNGRWLTEQPHFLLDILRREWGFEGLVMTDWFAVADTRTSLAAGLDLEMPGPGRALGSTLVVRVERGELDVADLDAAVRRLLGALDRIGALDAPTPPLAPMPPTAEDRSLLRRVATNAIVLLRNDGTLPLDPGAIRRLAVIGAHASVPCLVGGGSAEPIPHEVVSPLDALTAALGGRVALVHARGSEVDRSAVVVGSRVLRAPGGFEVKRYAGTEWAGEVIDRRHLGTLRAMVMSFVAGQAPPDRFSERVRGTLVPEEEGVFELALAQSGRARLFVDGELLLDGFTNPPPPGGTDFFGSASADIVAQVRLSAGVPIELVLEYANIDAAIPGYRVGFRTADADVLVDQAVAAVAAADAAIVFVGTTAEWETVGRDRESFGLPGRQDELVRRVAAVNARAVVVVNAGTVVDLPWADDVAAVLQCWFGGEEMAAAVADVVLGVSEPGGRLPTTIPARIEHNPAQDNFPGENGELRYGEGLFMGYRGYEHRAITPRFAFGYGLSYTSFEIGTPTLSSATWRRGDPLVVTLPVTNTGSRTGVEVVQCYVAPPPPRLARPPKELKAFAKVLLGPGETSRVELVLSDRAFAYWDPGQADWEQISPRLVNFFGGPSPERRAPGWQIDPGRYELRIGRSSCDIAHTVVVDVQ